MVGPAVIQFVSDTHIGDRCVGSVVLGELKPPFWIHGASVAYSDFVPLVGGGFLLVGGEAGEFAEPCARQVSAVCFESLKQGRLRVDERAEEGELVGRYTRLDQ